MSLSFFLFLEEIHCLQVFENEAFKNARRVSVYVNLNEGEIRTEEIIERILSEGKACFIPCFQPKATDMKMVRLESIEEYQSLPSTIWGIRQPPADQPREDALQSGRLSSSANISLTLSSRMFLATTYASLLQQINVC